MNVNQHYSSKTTFGNVIEASQRVLSVTEDVYNKIDEEYGIINEIERSINSKRSIDQFSSGFVTASGSAIKVSDKSLERAYHAFHEVSKKTDEGTYKAKDRNTAFESPISQKTSTVTDNNNRNEFSLGFATASGSAIKVSDKALQRAHKIFDEVSKEINGLTQTAKDKNSAFKSPVPQTTMKDISMSDKSEFSFGFATASGSAIKVSDKALQRAHKIFDEVSKERDQGANTAKDRNNAFESPLPQKSSTVTGTNNKTEFSLGFATAGGSAIKVSDKALQRAHKIFDEVSKERDQGANTAKDRNNAFKSPLPQKSSTVTGTNNKTEFSFGFATASGSAIKVSDKALQRAHKIFDEVSVETDEGTSITKDKNSIFKSPVPQKSSMDTNNKNEFSLGFATASGSAIKVSDKALQKAHQAFHEVYKENEKTCNLEDEAYLCDSELLNIELENNHSQSINATSEALIESQDLYRETQKQVSGDSEYNPALKPLQKRKIDFDEHVIPHRQNEQSQFKKVRVSNDFTISETVSMSPTENFKEEKNPYNTKDSTSRTSNNEVFDMSLIIHEIENSNTALLDDVRNSDEQMLPPKEIIENEDTESIPSSPIVGRQIKPKKRRNREGKELHKGRKSVSGDTRKSNDDRMETSKEKNCSLGDQNLELHKNNWGTLDSTEFDDSPLLMEFINQSITISERRSAVGLEQDEKIRLKRINRPKPTVSHLYFYKKSNAKKRLSWHEISKGSKPTPCTYEELIKRRLPSEILDITTDNAIEYKFACGEFYGQEFVQNNINGIKMEDDALLILDEHGHAGITEIKRAFLASPGVDPNLVPAGWIENHYKWIVWKLASMDRIKLGSLVLSRALTPNQVMMQLKYRYCREIDRFQRPALRRILEKDDTSTKRMVLCVSSIIECEDPLIKLILTDGWYSVRASVDLAMIKHIASGKVREGTKLLIYGSVLQNCDQGYAPLEAPDSVSLKIHTNSTRRARWDVKLGYAVPSGPFCVRLNTIDTAGGLIGKIKVTVARVYPMLYHEKTSSNESIFRNDRCEEKANNAYEKERAAMIDSFYAGAEKYFNADLGTIDSPADSVELAAHEWNEGREKLSNEEFVSRQEFEQFQNDCRKKEEEFRMKLESRLQKTLPPPRQVTPVLKVRVVEGETSADLQIWSPSEDVIDVLKEGTHISVTNLLPAGRRGNELRLTANRNSSFRQINIPNVIFPQRTCTLLSDIEKSIFTPPYGEFDTIGIIVSVGTEPYGMKNFEAVHLAYPRSDSGSSYLSILFWQGISSYGYKEILTVGTMIACTNLEWRRATPWSLPVSYCTERTSFTRSPRPSYLQQAFQKLKSSITDIETYISDCAAEISEEVQKRPTSRLSDGNNFNKSLLNDSVKRFTNQTLQEFTERSLLTDRPARSPAIQKRLEKLKCMDEPPSLSPIVIRNSSRSVSSPFRSVIDNQTKARTSLGTQFQL